MTNTRDLALSTAHLKRLISHARRDLEQARQRSDEQAAARAERRMNALLDRLLTGGTAPVGRWTPMPTAGV